MRIRSLLFRLGFFLMLVLSWPQFLLYAQSDNPGGTIPPGGTITGTVALYLPLVAVVGEVTPAPTPTPTAVFAAVPVQPPPLDRPAVTHADVNLALRSYVTTTGVLDLLNIGGDTDVDAPQFAGLFTPPRRPAFTTVYQVYDWNWSCVPNGCRGDPISNPQVTLLALTVTPGEPLFIPTRGPQIYGGGYKALVLYAEETRLTLAYTREDTAARGYVVHLEDLLVDPALLALYRAKDAAGRQELPALHTNERFANASGPTLKVVVRDTGSFMDPRSRKDWWVGY